MRGSKHYLDGLLTIHELTSVEAQRAAWRQGMATLAEAALQTHGVPLEGKNPELLLRSVRAAMGLGFLDELSFLSPPASACALYGLASGLPFGPERREIGRRVLLRLHEGDAATFVAVSTTLALASTRAFEGPMIRARVSLALALPISTGTRVDALALALISRRELAQRWVVELSTGPLRHRRLAARLIERAAREAARRATQGDDGGVWLFDAPIVQTAWAHLMNDREPLVWRHIATARGFLSAVVPRFAEEVERDLAAGQSSSKVRRGAASLAARVALAPAETLARARDLLGGSVLARDSGIASAMIYGLARAAEIEPEAAEALLLSAVEKGGALAAEALVELRREWGEEAFGARAAEVARVVLRQRHGVPSVDDGHAALLDVLCEELGESGGKRSPDLFELVRRALVAFAEQDARAAHEAARAALSCAEERVTRLEALREEDGPRARQLIFRTLHELDVGLLESSTLADLLNLGGAGHDTAKAHAPFHDLLHRLLRALMRYEAEPHSGEEEVPHLTLRMRRLRTLLHLLDIDSRHDERPELREERRGAVHALFERASLDAPSAMDRIVHATAARGSDSLVRDEVFELSDVVLAAASHIPTPEGFAALSEGSMLPEVKACTKALASVARTLERVAQDNTGRKAIIESLFDLSRALPAESSPRTEGLRSALHRLARALRHITVAGSLREVAADRRALELLERAVDDLVQLHAGARHRLGGKGADVAPTSGHGVWALGLSIERAVIDDDRTSLELTIETLSDSLRAELPQLFATLSLRVLLSLLALPLAAPKNNAPASIPPAPIGDRPLAGFLPPGRVLGGFYVVRALSSAAIGSVFVVKLAAQRYDDRAPLFALKVPEYNGSTARFLSEDEFLRLFCQEAAALRAVPAHPNLAGFVAFDGSVRPKPILVTELVRGPSVERALAKGAMDIAKAMAIVDGVLQGLEAMHEVGLAHLDLRPPNVILREGEGFRLEPVLVDYGLSGKQVRPGCVTGFYGAPEIWERHTPHAPMPCDIYALGCLTYEILTTRRLFDLPTESELVAAQKGHDGRPEAVLALIDTPTYAALGQWLSLCLRRDPQKRATAGELRRALVEVKKSLASESWPLPVGVDSEFG